MGPKQSNSTKKTQQVQTIQISHPIFANSKHIQVEDDVRYLRTEIRLANKDQFDEWEARAKKAPENYSLMQPIQQFYTSEGICGDSGITTITYEDYPYLLSDEIHNRKGVNNKHFEENQLWYLVYTLLSSTYNYHIDGRKTGDIRPDNIFINADGHVKVASVDSWPGEQTNYEKSFFEKTTTYLSPQQIKDLHFGKVQEDCNKELAQTFSVGLTILDVATLSSSKDLYSKGMKFNYEKLQKRIQEFRQIGYSDVLTLTIESMCQVDTEFRAKARQLFEWLHPHEEAITNLQDFELEGYPEKMIDLMERNQKIERKNQRSQKVITSLNSQQNSSYGPVELPTPYVQSPYTPTGIPSSSSMPSTILGPLGPIPTISSYAPSQINPLPSYNPPALTSYTPLSINPLPSYDPPSSNYTLGYEGSLAYSLPQSSYVPSSYVPSSYVPSSYVPSSSLFQLGKFPSIANKTDFTSKNLESHSFTLSKIDQQLEMSRKMFPQ